MIMCKASAANQGVQLALSAAIISSFHTLPFVDTVVDSWHCTHTHTHIVWHTSTSTWNPVLLYGNHKCRGQHLLLPYRRSIKSNWLKFRTLSLSALSLLGPTLWPCFWAFHFQCLAMLPPRPVCSDCPHGQLWTSIKFIAKQILYKGIIKAAKRLSDEGKRHMFSLHGRVVLVCLAGNGTRPKGLRAHWVRLPACLADWMQLLYLALQRVDWMWPPTIRFDL